MEPHLLMKYFLADKKALFGASSEKRKFFIADFESILNFAENFN